MPTPTYPSIPLASLAKFTGSQAIPSIQQNIIRLVQLFLLSLASNQVWAESPLLFTPVPPAEQRNLANPLRQYMQEFPVQPQIPEDPSLKLEVERKKLTGKALKPGLKIDVRGFKLTGLSEVNEAELQAVIQPFIGPQKGFDDLEAAINAIAEHLRSQGYFLAQAYLPAQKIAEGIVEIAVIEGRIGEVRVEIAEGLKVSRDLVESILSVLKPGSVIKEGSVERALFIVGDLRGLSAHSVMQPGKQTGTADLVVTLSPGKEFEYNLDADNMGSQFTGRYRLGAGAGWNNPLGLGDNLAGRALFSTDGGLAFGRASYLVPVGPYGTRAGLAYTHLEYEITQGPFAASHMTGNANVVSAFLIHPIVRGRNLNLFGTIGYDWRKQEDTNPLQARLQDQTEIQDFHVGNLGITGDSRDNLLGGGINSFNASLTLGGLDIATSLHRLSDLSALGHGTAGAYQKGNLSFSRLQTIYGPFMGFLSVSGQVASKNLSSAEKFSLGGPMAVRAYGVGESPSDEMVMVTAELRANLPKPELIPGDLQTSIFLDSAHGRLFQNPLPTDLKNGQHRMGTGLGLTWGRQEDFLLRGYVAWRLTEQSHTGTSGGFPQIFFSLTKNF